MTKKIMQYTLAVASVLGLLALAWFKGTDISLMLPSILGLYWGGHTAQNISAGWALSKDPNADTAAGIDNMEKH